ncbi:MULTISPECIES: cytochrome c-type biogenesis protein [Bosea]|uniref:cytochrome c-type biogenesis protein n=1 Tax=Bosea TaxID=85413 RepID=UPI00214FAFC4|nr:MULTISPECIES: cytochrome c-type biogenesis protein [Bosea]MCR4523586.1 cytochrome c-type biogenesis protein CcmH [Bosea sp. 47.2.35]MDR6827006.1 cytochrome c-type biogenesis protein CcmH [Bosea robiniae]MDR6893716.1 cytochrome c-type biogenesis protein CcmH [Bosea sp. BE109]MDR7136584.1 cytochrome c-type biogenesis protein CcmH [Bosea sp. BE168]MDR7173283.1 cytochrome c-type biogenesis protein CcmH [Bosea sp. BE271]
MRRIAFILGLMLLAAPAVQAVQPDEILPNAALEQRARNISGGLRCLVCQNQSIDDSDAPLARDLRILVRERIVAGDDDKAVVDFVVARYGDFVLLRPPLNAQTLLLWGAPFLILLAGMAFVWRRGRQRIGEEVVASVPLTDEERSRVDRLMRDERG